MTSSVVPERPKETETKDSRPLEPRCTRLSFVQLLAPFCASFAGQTRVSYGQLVMLAQFSLLFWHYCRWCQTWSGYVRVKDGIGVLFAWKLFHAFSYFFHASVLLWNGAVGKHAIGMPGVSWSRYKVQLRGWHRCVPWNMLKQMFFFVPCTCYEHNFCLLLLHCIAISLGQKAQGLWTLDPAMSKNDTAKVVLQVKCCLALPCHSSVFPSHPFSHAALWRRFCTGLCFVFDSGKIGWYYIILYHIISYYIILYHIILSNYIKLIQIISY